MRRSVSLVLRLVAVLTLLALVAAACGDDDASSPDSSSGGEEDDSTAGDDPLAATGFVVSPDDEGTPTEGGTLTFGPFAPARSLDPARATDSGVGNAEISAIYDALMRYDYAAGEYVPWQAESLEPNEDHSVWTLRIRDGITFSDGEPLDSAAVALQMERTQELRPGTYVDGITTETPDDLTVVYTLEEPWVGFPYALSVNPGRIPSPAAVEAAGEDYGTEPVGAGPFVMSSWTPGEELVLTKNEDYWAEGPYLDELRFVAIRGDQARLDSMVSGEIDAGFVRSADVVTRAVEDGFHGFNNVLSVGEALIINNGVTSDEVPGNDLRVRQAIALAINPEALNDIVSNGVGLWGKRMMSEASEVSGTVEAVPYDPDAARELLDAAKADGFDGGITLTCDAAPEREREGLALQAQLNAVGFDVELNVVPSVVDTIQAYLGGEGNYEIACYGFSFQDAAPYVGPVQVLTPGEGNGLGYESEEIESLLQALRVATGPEETATAVDALQELMNEEQPFIPLAATRELIAWDQSVRGMDVSAFSMPLFNEAWISE